MTLTEAMTLGGDRIRRFARGACARGLYRIDRETFERLRALWFDPDAPRAGQSSDALLLPLYDELTLSYPMINFPQATGHPHSPGEDLFVGCVIIAKTNVGIWRRTVKGRKIIMEIALAPEVLQRSRTLV